MFANPTVVADIVDLQKPETWIFQFTLSIWTDEAPPTSDEEKRHLFRSYLSTYCEPYRSVAAWLADDIHISGENVSAFFLTATTLYQHFINGKVQVPLLGKHNAVE